MKWSEIQLKTYKEEPSGSLLPSHSLLVRGGYLFSISQGIFVYNTLLLRAIRKLEHIVRQEIEKEGAREILMPFVQPKELWEETNRWNEFKDLLQKMKNRSEKTFCLGPTHEEVVTSFVRSSLKSYKDMPFNLYQIQTKYRDEIRPRFGLMRAREFIMKDAYSFDRNKEDSLKNYKRMFKAYTAIFNKLDVTFCVVQADSGNIGGEQSEEFQILADKGEDVVLVSDKSSFAINREICPVVISPTQKKSDTKKQELEKFKTEGVTTIDQLSKFLKVSEEDLVKILFIYLPKKDQESPELVAFLCLGNDEINLIKIKKAFSLPDDAYFADKESVKKISGALPGSCGPVGLKCSIYADHKLKNKTHFITGANEDGFHLKGVSPERDFKIKDYGDFCFAKSGDPSPDGKGTLVAKRGIEVGHLFYLSDKYSRLMNLEYLDDAGKKQFVEMGCYGIGITRTIQAVVEQSHDKDGIIWPFSIAPFLVHVCLINAKDEETLRVSEKIVSDLEKEGIDSFVDDRKERPGVKFKDADLLGMPVRLNIGERDLKDSQIEIVIRKTQQKEKVSIESLVQKIKSILTIQ